jgi:hypothetical protein
MRALTISNSLQSRTRGTPDGRRAGYLCLLSGCSVDSFRDGLECFLGAQELKLRSPNAKDEPGLLTGSTSFCGFFCMGQKLARRDVQCMLTRRTRLQYMQCNGVGGSTC